MLIGIETFGGRWMSSNLVLERINTWKEVGTRCPCRSRKYTADLSGHLEEMIKGNRCFKQSDQGIVAITYQANKEGVEAA